MLRIGELGRRLGVSDHVLRAWESRYGLLQPVRSAGGFRLYSEADEARIRRMQVYLAEGLSAAEAARAALGGDPSPAPGPLARPPAKTAGCEPFAGLRRALDAFDEPAAQAVLDRLMAELSLPLSPLYLRALPTARSPPSTSPAPHPRRSQASPAAGAAARAAGPPGLPARRAA